MFLSLQKMLEESPQTTKLPGNQKLNQFKKYDLHLKKATSKFNFASTTNVLFSVQAAICRNSTGTIVKALYQYNPPYKDSDNEAQAVLLAVVLACSLELNKFSTEGHSSTVISSIQQPSLVLDWHLNSIITKSTHCRLFKLIFWLI